MDHSLASLDLADRIGARCCVNVSGSRGAEHWAGPHPKNLTEETFDMIVQLCRFIIDTVKPTQTYWTIEAMPWAYPHTVDTNLQLLRGLTGSVLPSIWIRSTWSTVRSFTTAQET